MMFTFLSVIILGTAINALYTLSYLIYLTKVLASLFIKFKILN